MTRRRKIDEEIEAHRADVAAERERRNATIATMRIAPNLLLRATNSARVMPPSNDILA
jgi:hypothetical protein